jgi:hypothetical protein
VHFQETPELFMENISSLTGKSPSTTGAGSEGALTKGPFNALPPIIDLNNALVSHILTGTNCFITAAGYLGPNVRVDHDISVVIPEVWSRMEPHEREIDYLISHGYLEQCQDFEHEGKTVLASRLGYRITSQFVSAFFGRVFDNPNAIFVESMLRPELQDIESFADGIDNIVSTQKSIAENYFADGSIEFACPPLRALLHIMRDGEFEGKSALDPEIRTLFSSDELLKSDWYETRLQTQKQVDELLWRRHLVYLTGLLDLAGRVDKSSHALIASKIKVCETMLGRISSADYAAGLVGFIGADAAVVPS